MPGILNAAVPWTTLGGNAQHTGLSATAAQPLQNIHWSTPVDATTPTAGIVHYGSPLATSANTVLVPVKTSVDNAFRLDARAGGNGALIWSMTTDYLLP